VVSGKLNYVGESYDRLRGVGEKYFDSEVHNLRSSPGRSSQLHEHDSRLWEYTWR